MSSSIDLSRKILWGTACVVFVAVIAVSVSSVKQSERASLIPELKTGSASSNASEKIYWISSSSISSLPTESQAIGRPFIVKETGKVMCTANGKATNSLMEPLQAGEYPNHIVIDFKLEEATQCVRDQCKTIAVRFQNLAGTPISILPQDIKELLDIQLFTEGKYHDLNPDGSYYYGPCFPIN
jgi:hypothetical protein